MLQLIQLVEDNPACGKSSRRSLCRRVLTLNKRLSYMVILLFSIVMSIAKTGINCVSDVLSLSGTEIYTWLLIWGIYFYFDMVARKFHKLLSMTFK